MGSFITLTQTDMKLIRTALLLSDSRIKEAKELLERLKAVPTDRGDVEIIGDDVEEPDDHDFTTDL